MKDNLETIADLFTIEVDEKRFAGGWRYVCKKCGKEPFSVEGFFPCIEKFVPLKLKCDECGSRWVLKMEPTSKELEERTVN